MAITEPTAIDPYRAQEVEGIGVTKLLFVGLLGIDNSEQRVAPAVARAWERSDDGRTWVFRLRGDVSFSNGEPVDAAAFVRGVNRALDPEAGTETAYHVAGVRGFDRVRDGSAPTLEGLTAVDPSTLVVELAEPDFEFDKKTVQPIFSPVPSTAGAANNSEFNDRPTGNGPYMMAEPWRHDRSITLRRNPLWWGPTPPVDEIHIDILDPVTAVDDEYAGFTEGRYDYARIPAQLVPEAREKHGPAGGFLERAMPGLHYLIPFCQNRPMASVAARRAVSTAIDRAAISRRLFSGTRTPAASLVSPWFTDAHTPDLGEPYTGHDPELARACAAEARLSPGTRVDLAYNTGAGHDGWVEAVADQLRQVLELDVRTHPMTARELVEHRTSRPARGLCRAGWVLDYPTPDNVLFPLLHSSCIAPDAEGTAHGDNEGRYVNPDFDAAVARARAAPDEHERARLWGAAERLAMADMALIPLWFQTEYRVFDARRFPGLDIDFFGQPDVLGLPAPDAAG